MRNLKDITSIKELRKLKFEVEQKRCDACMNEDYEMERWFKSDLNAVDRRIRELRENQK